MEERSVGEMSLEELQEELYKPRRKVYRPGIHLESVTTRKKPISEEFLEELEQEGDFEKVFEKYVRKITIHPGSKKEEAKKYLMRVLIKAREEGRI